MFEPFKNATRGAQIVHVLLTLFLFLSWVSTMVTFGSSMMKVHHGDADLDFSWRTIKRSIYLNGHINDEVSVRDYNEVCASGGEAALAFAVFAFLAFLIHIPMFIARMAGLSFPMIRDAAHSMTIEFYLTCLEFFCFFIQVCVYGGTCFTYARNNFISVTGTGFGLMLSCFFFLIICLIFYVMMRSNTSYAVGDGSGKASDHTGYGDNSYASSNNEYNNDISSQPTFSYQGGDETSS